MITAHTLSTLAITLLFCLVFLRGRSLKILGELRHRTVISVAGGAAVAYVFMDLAPELELAASGFRAKVAQFDAHVLAYGVHLATMVGFLFFYGLEELVIRSHGDGSRQSRDVSRPDALFRIHMIAFCAYAWVVSYLLVRSMEKTPSSLVFYAVAMALHFLSVAHTLREEHGAVYDRIGARLLAASSLAGWGCGMVFALPDIGSDLLLGLVAGGVIANTTISELPREKEGRFIPFLVGAAAYTGLLFLAG